jgi:hypothetical protein
VRDLRAFLQLNFRNYTLYTANCATLRTANCTDQCLNAGSDLGFEYLRGKNEPSFTIIPIEKRVTLVNKVNIRGRCRSLAIKLSFKHMLSPHNL